MNNLDKWYQNLLQDILDNGVQKGDRTGTGTLSVFGRQIRHKMSEGFPILTTKKVHFKSIVTELLWFLRGDTNIKYLVDNDCHIWDGDCYQAYLKRYEDKLHGVVYKDGIAQKRPFSNEEFIHWIKDNDKFCELYGDLGPIYGKQWRQWRGDRDIKNSTMYHTNYDTIDQITNLINDLKTNPDSRRLMVNSWAVHDLSKMVLPPCHYGFQVWTRELSRKERMDYWFKNNKPNRDVCDSVDESSELEQHEYFDMEEIPKRAISLMFNMRSVDTFLGLPFNIASYGLLLEIIAKEVNMVPDELIGNLGDTHLYLNHINQAKEQIDREPRTLPKLDMNPIFLANLEHKGLDEAINGPVNFELENYQSHSAIKAPLNN